MIRDLIRHQQSVHKRNIKVETRSFPSMKQFLSWKEQVERENMSHYFKTCGTIRNKSNRVSYYYCHRSGFYRHSIENRCRSLKSQGTSKISTKCCSYITARECTSTGLVSVDCCLDHTGHDIERAHLKISGELRTVIAGKLANGMDTSKVLDDIRDHVSDTDRDSLVTRKDIDNIRMNHPVSKMVHIWHVDDVQSVSILVQELRVGTYDPIVVHKVKGQEHHSLKKEDFLLGLQTDFQRNMMQKYGHKMICVESTHSHESTTLYEFVLTTLLVSDDNGEAIPTAWAISNREDVDVLKVFLADLKAKGDLDYKTELFMNDQATTCNFFKAWCETFPKPVTHFYCLWHVDKAWKKHIESLINSKEDQSEIYRQLKIVQMEPDERIFRKKLQELLLLLQDTLPAFFNFFHSHYVVNEKVRFWAPCFRRGTAADTNALAKSFDRVSKSVYYKWKQNRRVDNLLVALLKLSRDKAIEQLMKSVDGMVTHQLQEMKKRHNDEEAVKNITCIMEEQSWSVTSSSTGGLEYKVCKVASHEACECKLVCDVCRVCVHMYSCTCADFLLNAMSCNHIHAVHSVRTTPDMAAVDPEAEDHAEEDHAEEDHAEEERLLNLTDLFSICENEASKTTDDWRRRVFQAIGGLTEALKEDCSDDIFRTVTQHVQQTIAIIAKAKKANLAFEHNYEKRHAFPSNKYNESRLHFHHSTKQKSTRGPFVKLCKPTAKEQQDLSKTAPEVTPLICVLCFQEEDMAASSNTEWVECKSCRNWVHSGCDLQLNSYDDYECSVCKSYRLYHGV